MRGKNPHLSLLSLFLSRFFPFSSLFFGGKTIDDEERHSGITGICASVDGVWVFCTTDDGLLKVFKRGKPPRRKGKKRTNQQGAGCCIRVVGPFYFGDIGVVVSVEGASSLFIVGQA